MRKKQIVKQKIKGILSKLPRFRNFFQMEEESQGRNRRYGVISEPVAKQYVDLDLAAMWERHSKRKELIHVFTEKDKDCSDLAEAEEIEDAKLLASFTALVSIIIINRNGAEKLQILMNSFHERDFYRNFEIIFIDNGSTDESVAFMRSWEKEFDIKIIRNQTNTSFSAANNQGARESSGQYLLFLNNDTEVTDGWLDELLIAMEKADEPGAIGAKLIYPHIPDGTVNEGKSYCIQHTGISFFPVIWKNNFYYEPYNRENGFPDDHLDDRLVERAGVTAAALLIKKDVFEKAGGFDVHYNYGYEDVDLCLKLIRSGYRNYYCPTCLIFHYESATQLKDYSEEREKRWEQNAAVLKEKWEKYLNDRIFIEKLAGQTIYSEEKPGIAIVMDKTAPAPFLQDLPATLESKGFSVYIITPANAFTPYRLNPHIDILLSFSDSYDISKIRNAIPYIRKIAWPELKYEKWCRRKFFGMFDLVITSDTKACQYIDMHSVHKSILLSNPDKDSDKLVDSFIEYLVRTSK